MEPTSTVFLSQSALQNNLDFIRNLLAPECVFSSVVKGNAYGHGIETYVPMAENCGVNHFSVFSAQEAKRVFDSATGRPEIMIMGYIAHSDLPWAIQNDIQFFIFDLPRLRAASLAAQTLGKKARIHLELDTGLNRTGLTKKELTKALEVIKAEAENFEVEGVCTHFAGAESIANYVRVKKQLKKFHALSAFIVSHGITPKRKHTACSAAVISYPQTHMDMVRVGIMQYGFWSSKETFINYLHGRKDKVDPLKRVISWRSKVMTTHRVKAGEFIGYGTSFMAEDDMKIAIVSVGYAEGYSRSLSNQGRILLNGQRVGVLGMVNMNMLAVDIGNVPETKIGDEVVLIGHQGEMSISVASFSELSVQLNYELLTRLPGEIPRITID